MENVLPLDNKIKDYESNLTRELAEVQNDTNQKLIATSEVKEEIKSYLERLNEKESQLEKKLSEVKDRIDKRKRILDKRIKFSYHLLSLSDNENRHLIRILSGPSFGSDPPIGICANFYRVIGDKRLLELTGSFTAPEPVLENDEVYKRLFQNKRRIRELEKRLGYDVGQFDNKNETYQPKNEKLRLIGVIGRNAPFVSYITALNDACDFYRALMESRQIGETLYEHIKKGEDELSGCLNELEFISRSEEAKDYLSLRWYSSRESKKKIPTREREIYRVEEYGELFQRLEREIDIKVKKIVEVFLEHFKELHGNYPSYKLIETKEKIEPFVVAYRDSIKSERYQFTNKSLDESVY